MALAATLALVERRLAGLVLALEAADRPAERLAVENLLREVRAALAPRGLRRVS